MKFKRPSYHRMIEISESIEKNGVLQTKYADYYITGDLLVNKKTLCSKKLFLSDDNQVIKYNIVNRYLEERDIEYELDHSNLCECMKCLLDNSSGRSSIEIEPYIYPVYTGDIVYIMSYDGKNSSKELDFCPVCGKKITNLMMKKVKNKVNQK